MTSVTHHDSWPSEPCHGQRCGGRRPHKRPGPHPRSSAKWGVHINAIYAIYRLMLHGPAPRRAAARPARSGRSDCSPSISPEHRASLKLEELEGTEPPRSGSGRIGVTVEPEAHRCAVRLAAAPARGGWPKRRLARFDSRAEAVPRAGTTQPDTMTACQAAAAPSSPSPP